MKRENKQDLFPHHLFPPSRCCPRHCVCSISSNGTTSRSGSSNAEQVLLFFAAPIRARNNHLDKNCKMLPKVSDITPSASHRMISRLPTNLPRSQANLLPIKPRRRLDIPADLQLIEKNDRYNASSLQISVCLTQRLGLVRDIESARQMCESLLTQDFDQDEGFDGIAGTWCLG